MQFGIFDHVDDSGLPIAEHYEVRLSLVEAMDRLGFYSYHVAEHHGTPLGLAPSPSVYLAAVAQRTRRLKFGPLVYVAALYHPMRLAEEICMLDQLSRGRLQVGVGRGAVWPEHEIYDVDPSVLPERYLENLSVVLEALNSTTVSHSGKSLRVREFEMVLRPYQKPRPPLWYGIGNPESAVWAAANDVNVVSLQPASVARGPLDRYRHEWAARGKSEAEIPFLGLARHVVVADTDEAARHLARAAFPRWRASFSHIWERRGVKLPFTRPADWDALEAAGLGIAGAPATVREYLDGQTRAAGANFALCQMVFGSMDRESALRSLTLFAEKVAPQLAG